jgi:hypothetical protein
MIRDLLAEMVPTADQATPVFRALVGQTPGGAITCPYCQRAVEYDRDGQSLVVSTRKPLRYSRAKMELRARDYGSQKNPPDPAMTPEQWIAEEKRMPGQGYVYVEDGTMKLTHDELEFLSAWAREVGACLLPSCRPTASNLPTVSGG